MAASARSCSGQATCCAPGRGRTCSPHCRARALGGYWIRCRLAFLDRQVTARLSRYPELTGRLVARALERSRNLAVNMAIVHQPRVEVRLHMLLWHLADRWGRVGPDGITLSLDLTHAVLGDLVAAQRPTVTTCLSELAKRHQVRAVKQGWLISGEPPIELLEVRTAQSGPSNTRSASGSGLPISWAAAGPPFGVTSDRCAIR